MKIILASAKIMNVSIKREQSELVRFAEREKHGMKSNDRLKPFPDISLSTPRFQNEAQAFAKDMAQYSTETIAEILGCSHQIASQNRLRFMQFFNEKPKLPAILAYHGQAYKHLKAETLTSDGLNYSQETLWITSFLYGLLRPLDGILPYRMEGNVELPSGEGQNMFGFWKNRLTDVLIDSVKADDGILIHLATEEYQHLFDWQRVRKEIRVIQPLFYVKKGNDLKIQAVWAKTCRGAMTRFIIDNQITNPDGLSAFSYMGFEYEPMLGEPDFPHFIKQ
ncbi:MAG: YaaA family protein [Bacteroidaceae bacterium]|nr:YaaA family protein [Bacteroidaceae bacterium]